MANSEDVVWMACESHLRRFGHVANCAPCLAVTLDYVRAEVRELRKDKARLDWLLNHSLPISVRLGVDDWHVIENREDIDEAMGGREGEA